MVTYVKLSQLYLVESLALEPLTQHVPDPGEIVDRLFPHGLGHEVAMLLRSGRHSDYRHWCSVRRIHVIDRIVQHSTGGHQGDARDT